MLFGRNGKDREEDGHLREGVWWDGAWARRAEGVSKKVN